jgi:hypothetical protein
MKSCFYSNVTNLLLLSIFALFFTPLRAQNICTGELILQPDGAAGKDAAVSSKPDQVNVNLGDHEQFNAMAWTWSGVPGTYRNYIDFDLSAVPAGATINSATLSLTAWPWGLSGDPCLSGSNEAYIRRVTSPWTENTITWNNQPTVTNVGQVYVPALCAINTDLSINLTATIQDMVDNPANDYGLQFALATEDYYRAMIFHSTDSDEAAKRPKLVVQYSMPCPCTGELVLQPDGAAGKDAPVWSRPDQVNVNQGDHELFSAMAWTWSGVPGTVRNYIDFDLSAVPAGATINSATLSLTAWPWDDPCLSGSNEAYIRRVTSPWAENTITWNNQPTVTNVGQVYVPALCVINTDLSINLTAMIQDMVDNPANDYGLQFALATEDFYRAMVFHSTDSDETAKRPKLVVQYSMPCPCTGELVLQPDGAAGKDAPVWSKPDQVNVNKGDHELFSAMAWTWSGVPGTYRNYIDFDLSAVPAGATINSATLSLTAWPWDDPCLSGSNEAYIRRVTSPWSENTITWNNQPTVTNVGQLYIPALCVINTDLSINLTAMIQDMVDNPANDYGLQFALATEDFYRAMVFHSTDSDEAAKRPKLVVQYTVECDSSVSIFEKPRFQNTVQLFPNPTTGVISLRLEQPLVEKARLRLFNLQGKLLREEMLSGGIVEQQLDLTLFQAGFYVVEIRTEGGASWHSKIVKQ